MPRGTTAVVSKDGRLLALVAGKNNDEQWVKNSNEVHKLIKESLHPLVQNKSSESKMQRRGAHSTLLQGISMGVGRTVSC